MGKIVFVLRLSTFIAVIATATHFLDRAYYRPRAVTCHSTVGWNEQGLRATPGINVINPGADLTLIEANSEREMKAFIGDTSDNVLDGVYLPDQEAIVVLGPWTRASETVIHEYEHYLEHMFPEDAAKLRAAFLELETPAFRIGYADLDDPATLPAKP